MIYLTYEAQNSGIEQLILDRMIEETALAISLLSEERTVFYCSDVEDLVSFDVDGTNRSLVVWVARNVGASPFKDGGVWEFYP